MSCSLNKRRFSFNPRPWSAPTVSVTPFTAVQPLEALALPECLDGRNGTNRGAPETAQLAARHDLDAVRAWLSNYADTQTTFDTYRKEAERLMLWAIVQRGKPLSSLTHEDLQ